MNPSPAKAMNYLLAALIKEAPTTRPPQQLPLVVSLPTGAAEPAEPLSSVDAESVFSQTSVTEAFADDVTVEPPLMAIDHCHPVKYNELPTLVLATATPDGFYRCPESGRFA